MYGLVNKAIEEMVCTHFDRATWERIQVRSGLDGDPFLAMQQYPDHVTYQLVDSASDTLHLDHATILREFGRYWMLYTSNEGYGELIKLTGESFREFLQNLDMLHARVGLSYPELRPPSFQCVDAADGSLHLHYYSDRAGLAPMVSGLIEGLAERFAMRVSVDLIASRDQGDDHEIFRIVADTGTQHHD